MKYRLLILIFIVMVPVISYLWINNGIENKRVIRTNSEITILLSQHPYVEAVISELDKFSDKTGINVNYHIIPEDDYYKAMKTRLSSGFNEPDVIMTGPYFIWELSHENILEDLTPYYMNQEENNDIDDFFPNVLEIYRYNEGDGIKTYGLPLGFEVAVLAYNERIFDELNLEVPKTYDQLIQICKTINNMKKDGLYAIAMRGNEDWAMLNTSYISMYANYLLPNGNELNLTENLLDAKSIEMHKKWLDLVKEGTSPEWDRFTWGIASAAFGAGEAAMLFDMDNVAYYQNIKGESNEAGNIAWTTLPTIKEGDTFVSNLWSWGLSMNTDSNSKESAWLFIQYFTSKEFLETASTKYKLVLPPRKSVMESEEFISIIKKNAGYQEALEKTIPRAKVLLDKNYRIIEMLELWSKTIKHVSENNESINDEMKKLQKSFDEMAEEDNKN